MVTLSQIIQYSVNQLINTDMRSIIALNLSLLKRCVLVLLWVVITLNTAWTRDAQSIYWSSFNQQHTSFDINHSMQPQDGRRVAVIDGTTLEFNEKELVSSFGFRPEGYLFQTFSADRYHGKHLHVSAFARNSPPKFARLEEWFEEQFLLWRTQTDDEPDARNNTVNPYQRRQLEVVRSTSIEDITAWFSEHIRHSYTNANYGVMVVLHLTDKNGQPVTQLYQPTSHNRNDKPQLWHRFNVEVGIPESCEAISIVFWSVGVSRAEVDHFAIVEHGAYTTTDNPDETLRPPIRRRDFFNQLLNTVNTHAGNLSFED